MHPLFGTAEQQQFSAYDQPNFQQNYGGQQFAPVQTQGPPPQSATPGIYQPQQQMHPQQQMQQQQVPQQVNYQNFQQTFPGQQQQPQQTFSPPPMPVPEPPKQKLPIPEEFIYMQTVLEELKTQCINSAGNPVSSIDCISMTFILTNLI